MATVVVSGRVDEHIKREVDRIIEHAGKTPGDVIRDVWISIYETGKLPTAEEEEEKFRRQRERFAEFMAFRKKLSLTPTPSWLTTLDDAGMKELFAEREV